MLLAALGLAAVVSMVALTGSAVAGKRVKRRPGYIVGTARTECGRSLHAFTVSAYGFDGQPNVYPYGLPPLGTVRGHNGRYALRTVDSIRHKKPVNALVRAVEAYAPLRYEGHRYKVPLYPTDGKPDGLGRHDFSGHSGKGIIRNFVLRTSGLKPGFKRDRKLAVDPAGNAAGAFYGANILLFLSLGNVPGQRLTLSFRPLTRRLADGCRARAFTRSLVLGPYQGDENITFHDIPLAFYSVSATLKGSATRTVKLQVNPSAAPTNSVAFRPLPTSEWPDGSGDVNMYGS